MHGVLSYTKSVKVAFLLLTLKGQIKTQLYLSGSLGHSQCDSIT